MKTVAESSTARPTWLPLGLLDTIRRKPGTFWVNSDHPYTSLVAFLSGHQCGFAAALHGAELVADGLIPDGYGQFVTERFGRKYPDGGKGWQTIIRESAATEQEAFDLFFQLREEFERLATAQRQ
jgi:hypothetical protein